MAPRTMRWWLSASSIDVATEVVRRIMDEPGRGGAESSNHVAGSTCEEPQFDTFWEAVQDLGADIFLTSELMIIVPVSESHLENTIGNLAEHAMNYGVMPSGVVPEWFPNLEFVIALGSGDIPYVAARMNKAAGRWPDDSPPAAKCVARSDFLPACEGTSGLAPKRCHDRLSYDYCVFGPAQPRFLIDQVRIDRVGFIRDSLAPMVLTDSVRWTRGLDVLIEDEKRRFCRVMFPSLSASDQKVATLKHVLV